MEEKRKYIRFNIPLEINCRMFPGKKDLGVVRAKDVSLEGISILTDQRMNIGTIIEIEIKVKGGIQKTIIVTGEVKWQNRYKTEKNEYYETGIMFNNIKREERDKMKEIIIEAVREMLIKLSKSS